MGQLTNREIEEAAVRAVENEVGKFENMMSANFASEDTKISFDGVIQRYSDRKRSTKDWLPEIKVQIKGKEVQRFTKDKTKYSLSMDHFRNYYRNGGVLFFLVEVKPEGHTKIFYRHLLPLDLQELLSHEELSGKKSKTFEVWQLNSSLKAVCDFYELHSKKQNTELLESVFMQEKKTNNYVIASPTYSGNDIETDSVFKHQWYFYKDIEGLLIPFTKGIFNKVTQNGELEVEINKEKVKFKVSAQLFDQKFIFLIEDILEFIFDEKNKKFSYQMKCMGSLNQQLKAFNFLIHLFSGNSVSFEGNPLFPRPASFNLTTQDLDFLHEMYTVMQRAEQALNKLGINSDTIISMNPEQTNRVYADLPVIIEAVLENKFDKIKLNGSFLFTELVLGELRLLVAWTPWQDDKLVSAFDESVATYKEIEAVVTVEKEGKEEEVGRFKFPPYNLLPVEAFAYGSNIDFEMIRHVFDRFDLYADDDIARSTNDFCLKCIKAYDLSENNRSELLQLAKYLFSKDPEKNRNDPVNFLNVTQINKRLNGTLSDNDFDNLIALKQKNKFEETPGLHFGCNVLLGNYHEAKHALRSLSLEEQEKYKDFPIYKLYTDLTKM